MTGVQLSVTVFLGILSLGLSICPPLETDEAKMPACDQTDLKMECNFVEGTRLCEARCILSSGDPRVRFTCESGQEVVGSDGLVSCSDEAGEAGEEPTTATTEPATEPAPTEPEPVVPEPTCRPDGYEAAQDKDGDIPCTANILRVKSRFRDVPSERLCTVPCFTRKRGTVFGAPSTSPKEFRVNKYAGCSSGYKVARKYPHSNKYYTCNLRV